MADAMGRDSRNSLAGVSGRAPGRLCPDVCRHGLASGSSGMQLCSAAFLLQNAAAMSDVMNLFFGKKHKNMQCCIARTLCDMASYNAVFATSTRD